MKPQKKQIQIVATLLHEARKKLDELDIPYVLILDESPVVFTNVPQSHARGLMREALQLQEKIIELTIENTAEKLTAIPKKED
jgi:hypothetical protein